MELQPTFQSWNCKNQRIFLRADLNVPLRNGIITNDRRLIALQPTLDYLISKKAQIILATHIGRPNAFDKDLSTKQLIPWFTQRGYSITHMPTIELAHQAALLPKTILLLENLRFFPEEKNESIHFARQLLQLAPWYVNDAFGTLHRSDTSIALLAYQYPKTHRSIGFLIENELNILSHVMHNPKHPVTFILGGAKVADKIPLIRHLCSFADTIVLCPALVFTFLKALGKPTGSSLINATVIEDIAPIMHIAQNTHTKLYFPVDYQVTDPNKGKKLSYVDANNLSNNSIGVSIGPYTIDQIKKIISESHTVFYNGMMGFEHNKESLDGIKHIMKAMSQSSAITIVAGGDSIAIVDLLGLKGITHCLTGGGATLTYLSNQPLPGLKPFLENRTETD